jgi:hypothetical protein
MSDTPETDALEQKQSSEGCPQWNDMMRWVRENTALARKLERERDRLAEEIDKLRDIAEMLYELAMKNDVKWSFEEDGDSLAKLRAELDQLKEGGE